MFVKSTPLEDDSDYAVEVRAHAGQPKAQFEMTRRGLHAKQVKIGEYVPPPTKLPNGDRVEEYGDAGPGGQYNGRLISRDDDGNTTGELAVNSLDGEHHVQWMETPEHLRGRGTMTHLVDHYKTHMMEPGETLHWGYTTDDGSRWIDKHGHRVLGFDQFIRQAAEIKPLPVENGTYYRLHAPDREFSRADASTRNNGEAPNEHMKKYWDKKDGYSALWSPHHLHEYLGEMGWDKGAKGSKVIRFQGTPVGEGADGEPRVMPHSDKPDETMSVKRFRDRLDITPHPGTSYHDHTWGEGPQGRIVDDGYRSILGAKQPRVKVAGVMVVAADTGRLLLIQRSNEDKRDPARGQWEMPGGHLDEGEHAWEAAQREWSEETGLEFPSGHLAGNWISNGIYQAHLFVVPVEADLDLNPNKRDRFGNPDDPGGDDIESLAWWELPHLLRSNRSLRREFIEGLDRGLTAKVIREAKSLVKQADKHDEFHDPEWDDPEPEYG